MQIEIIPSKVYKLIILFLNFVVIISSILLNNIYLAIFLILISIIYSIYIIKNLQTHNLIINPQTIFLDNKQITDVDIMTDNNLYLILSYKFKRKTKKLLFFYDSLLGANFYDLRRLLYKYV